MKQKVIVGVRRMITNILNNNKTDINMKSKICILNISDDKAITLASSYLEQGQVIALPTDTIYGLACNANCPKAIQHLYSIKGRDTKKPVAICVSNLTSLRFWGEADHLSDELLHKLLPGPFTIVLNKTVKLNNPHLNQGTQKIGIRIPNFEFIKELCKTYTQPLALTSANKSNELSSLCIEEFEHLWPQLGAVFDGGKISLNEKCREGSTVIDLSVPGRCKIIREGIAYLKTVNVMNEFNILLE